MRTPIEEYDGVFVKREDLYRVAGVNGGKARTITSMSEGAAGIITSGPRTSSQIYIGARIAAMRGIPFRCHLPNGPTTPEMEDVVAHGGEIIQHKAGYNNVLAKRAADDSRGRPRWVVVPLWLRCPHTVAVVRQQCANIPKEVRRVVVVAGSGMTVAGVLHGIRDLGRITPVLAVCVGADPTKTLNTFGPFAWHEQCTLARPGGRYAIPLPNITFGGVALDPRYEAKVARYLEPGDLFWIAGHGIHHGKD